MNTNVGVPVSIGNYPSGPVYPNKYPSGPVGMVQPQRPCIPVTHLFWHPPVPVCMDPTAVALYTV